jgi:hypothetical protein
MRLVSNTSPKLFAHTPHAAPLVSAIAVQCMERMPDLTPTSIKDTEAFEERLRNVPLSPGVYLWKDAAGKIIYVGKSKALRDRMRSYFGAPRGLNGKTRRLVSLIADFDYIQLNQAAPAQVQRSAQGR